MSRIIEKQTLGTTSQWLETSVFNPDDYRFSYKEDTGDLLRTYQSNLSKSDDIPLLKFSESSEKQNLLEELTNLGKLKSILDITDQILSLHTNHEKIISRINILLQSIGDDDIPLVLDSLKGLVLFLAQIKNVHKPSITINEDGIWQTRWKKDKKNNLLISYNNLYTVNYVIFKPSLHNNGRIILNGMMDRRDFHDYIQDINIRVHISNYGRNYN